jgi:predicted RNA binding protein YcfA (HicA-like mRNA interferase family)
MLLGYERHGRSIHGSSRMRDHRSKARPWVRLPMRPLAEHRRVHYMETRLPGKIHIKRLESNGYSRLMSRGSCRFISKRRATLATFRMCASSIKFRCIHVLCRERFSFMLKHQRNFATFPPSVSRMHSHRFVRCNVLNKNRPSGALHFIRWERIQIRL